MGLYHLLHVLGLWVHARVLRCFTELFGHESVIILLAAICSRIIKSRRYWLLPSVSLWRTGLDFSEWVTICSSSIYELLSLILLCCIICWIVVLMILIGLICWSLHQWIPVDGTESWYSVASWNCLLHSCTSLKFTRSEHIVVTLRRSTSSSLIQLYFTVMLLFYWDKAFHIVRLILTSNLEVSIRLRLRIPLATHRLYGRLSQSTFNLPLLRWALIIHRIHVCLTNAHPISRQLGLLFVHLVVILGARPSNRLQWALHLPSSIVAGMTWWLYGWTGRLGHLWISVVPVRLLVILMLLCSYRLMLDNDTVATRTLLLINLRVVKADSLLRTFVFSWLGLVTVPYRVTNLRGISALAKALVVPVERS